MGESVTVKWKKQETLSLRFCFLYAAVSSPSSFTLKTNTISTSVPNSYYPGKNTEMPPVDIRTAVRVALSGLDVMFSFVKGGRLSQTVSDVQQGPVSTRCMKIDAEQANSHCRHLLHTSNSSLKSLRDASSTVSCFYTASSA